MIYEQTNHMIFSTVYFLISNMQDVHDVVSEVYELLVLVDTLSFKLKAVIVLRYYHDYSYAEIGTILDIPLGTVKSRHHQALQNLREKVGYSNAKKKEASTHVS